MDQGKKAVCPSINMIILLSSLIFMSLSFFGPIAGKGSWFTELSGDWSIIIAGDYEIGNSVDASSLDKFCIRKWDLTPMSRREYLRPIVDGVIDYNYNDEWIVARTDRKWFWINPQTDTVQSCYDDDFLKEAPDEIISLSKNMKAPKASYRYKNRILSFLLLVVFVIRICYQLITSRTKKCQLSQNIS